ncbi:HAD family hydrolase [Candidatus Giovannonibacteria bacterium]|nr:HAD family hydrolase [Candidatus Giovannonibacteria bacterium]
MEKHSRVIFFDLYQTLLDVKISSTDPTMKPKEELVGWEPFADALKKYGITIAANEFLKLYEKRRDEFYSANRDKNIHHHNMQKIIAEVLEKDFNIQRSPEGLLNLVYVYRKANRGWLRLYPGVFETLSTLSKKYTLSTASHTQGSFTQLELRELDIEKFFSYFVYSSDIGLRKESPDFYKRALEIVGRKSEDCIMVGDNYDVDVHVPQQLGIRAIWIKNPITCGRYPTAEEYQNYVNLDDIENLPNLVEKLLQKPL